MNKTIYLASRSPRRAELLQQIGMDFTVLPSDIDESVLPDESPADYVLRLAKRKAEVCFEQLVRDGKPMLPVLAADTSVAVDGEIFGKPENDADAYRMLRLMSGREHQVYTGIAVATESGVNVALSTTKVQMADLSEETIHAYIASGEPRDKAGAYGIQGLAGVMIRHIEGSYSGVMGLPIYEAAQLLEQAGIRLL